jgi:NAD(P)-dependent dehydrogenase (short-subunit alcohol dehydrogenase family)
MIVFAASSSRLSMLRDTGPDAWAEIFATNVIAPALVVRAALAHLSPGAICAFISSESVGMPYHGLVPYGASKAALEEVVRGQRLEHPDLRFSCIRVGQTMPTDFGRDFDPALAGDLFPKWIAHGRLPAQSMEVVELGTTIAEILMSAMVSPSVELQDVILRAPGGVFTGGIDSMLESIDIAHTTGGSG